MVFLEYFWGTLHPGGDIMEKRSNNSKDNTKGKSQSQSQAKAKPQSQSQKSSTEFAKEICPKK